MHRSRFRTHARLAAAKVSFSVAIALLSFAANSSAETPQPDKAGRMMANLKLGPSIGLGNMPSQFATQVNAGYAILGSDGYVTLSPQFQFGKTTTFALPVGFQYEFELPIKNLSNLYAYGHLSFGYAGHFAGGKEMHGATFQPEVGAKYLWTRRFHFGAEPFSLPVWFVQGGPLVSYRVYVYAGVNF